MKSLSFLGLVLVFSGLAACNNVVGGGGDEGGGGDGGGNDGGGGSSPANMAAAVQQACEEHSAAVCAKELECIADREKIIGPKEVCTERMTARCVSRFALPNTGLTPQALSACAGEMAAAGCGMLTTTPTACVFLGTRTAGQPCADDAQCVTGVCDGYFLPFYSGGCGVCATGSLDACLGGCDDAKMGCGYPEQGPACGFGRICPGDICSEGPQEGDHCGDPFFACTYPSTCQNETCVLEVSTSCY